MSKAPKLYLDEDVSALVAVLLRAHGIEVTTARETGKLGASDDEQLAFAVANGLCLVTHNRRHFERLAVAYSQTEKPHFGIVLAVRRNPYELARRNVALLQRTPAGGLRAQVRYV